MIRAVRDHLSIAILFGYQLLLIIKLLQLVPNLSVPCIPCSEIFYSHSRYHGTGITEVVKIISSYMHRTKSLDPYIHKVYKSS